MCRPSGNDDIMRYSRTVAEYIIGCMKSRPLHDLAVTKFKFRLKSCIDPNGILISILPVDDAKPTSPGPTWET
jgi:hypothetical protein